MNKRRYRLILFSLVGLLLVGLVIEHRWSDVLLFLASFGVARILAQKFL